MTELKPCPFCGGTASVVKNSNTWYTNLQRNMKTFYGTAGLFCMIALARREKHSIVVNADW